MGLGDIKYFDQFHMNFLHNPLFRLIPGKVQWSEMYKKRWKKWTCKSEGKTSPLPGLRCCSEDLPILPIVPTPPKPNGPMLLIIGSKFDPIPLVMGSKFDPIALVMGSRFDLDIGPTMPGLRFDGLPGLGEASATVMLLYKKTCF